jgi:hypothetical protein
MWALFCGIKSRWTVFELWIFRQNVCVILSRRTSSCSIGPQWLVLPEVLQPCRLIVRARLWKFPLAPPKTTRETLAGKGGTMDKKWPVILLTNGEFYAIWRDLLHAAKLRHGTDGFTFPPTEGHAEDFFALKNRTASAWFEPANSGYQRPTCYP